MTDPNAKNDASTDIPHARPTAGETGKPDQLKDRLKAGVPRSEALVDEGIEETFPASDPVSVKRIS